MWPDRASLSVPQDSTIGVGLVRLRWRLVVDLRMPADRRWRLKSSAGTKPPALKAERLHKRAEA
ncbi:MAG: hypothetical protein EB065_04760 [Betaproteobacteria bacterium]|nr:hypothetical protein [Betaproteobacteria bacterium]